MADAGFLLKKYSQDTTEILDYDINYAKWLLAGETIASSIWSVLPAGPTIDDPLPSFSASATKVWFKAPGATVGTEYDVTNHVVTSQGRHFEASIRILIVDR